MQAQAATLLRRMISGLVAFGLLLLLGAPLHGSPAAQRPHHSTAHAAMLLSTQHCPDTDCAATATATDACCVTCTWTSLPAVAASRLALASPPRASAPHWTVSRHGDGIRHQPALDPPILRA